MCVCVKTKGFSWTVVITQFVTQLVFKVALAGIVWVVRETSLAAFAPKRSSVVFDSSFGSRFGSDIRVRYIKARPYYWALLRFSGARVFHGAERQCRPPGCRATTSAVRASCQATPHGGSFCCRRPAAAVESVTPPGLLFSFQ